MFFDPSTVDREVTSSKSSDVLPNGVYVCQIDRASEKQKDASSQSLSLFMSVLSPRQFYDRTLFVNFNLMNASEQAEKIGKQQFCNLLDALGMGKQVLKDESLLQNKLVKVTVGQGKPYQGRPQNKILKYEPLNDTDKNAIKGIHKTENSDVSDIPF